MADQSDWERYLERLFEVVGALDCKENHVIILVDRIKAGIIQICIGLVCIEAARSSLSFKTGVR